MTIKLSSAVLGTLLALLLIQPVKADTFQVTGSTNATICAQLSSGCLNLSYDLLISTLPAASLVESNGLVDDYYAITNITGQIGGGTVSFVLPTLEPGPAEALLFGGSHYSGDDPICWDNVGILVNGVPWTLVGGPDTTVGRYGDIAHTVLMGGSNQTQPAWCTWNAVSVPEPSALLTLTLGILGFVGLKLLRAA